MKTNNKVAYIIGPYRASNPLDHRTQVLNIRKAEEKAIEYWQKGYAVICPHTNSSFFSGACEEEVFMNGYLEILKRCDLVVMLPNWKESSGSRAEHQLAKKLGLRVIYS